MSTLTDAQVGDLGGAVTDIFGALGQETAASAYTKAAAISTSNAAITASSGAITQEQENRLIMQTIGAEKASTAASGFETNSGGALDLMRSSVQQGALAKQLIANQSLITQQGFQQQAASETAQASQSKSAGTGGFLGGAIKIGAALFGL